MSLEPRERERAQHIHIVRRGNTTPVFGREMVEISREKQHVENSGLKEFREKRKGNSVSRCHMIGAIANYVGSP